MRQRPPTHLFRRAGRGSVRRWPGAAVAGAALVLAAACVPTDPGTTTTTTTAPTVSGVAVERSIGGFTQPWELAVTPDGTLLVTEKPGRLAAVVDGTRRVVATLPGVVSKGEGGLMGLAVDPGYATNRRIYTCFAAGTGTTVTEVRVVRYRVAEDLASVSDGTTILGGIPAGTGGDRHLGCRVKVGPDGVLWVTTGDAVLATGPQDPTSRAGKVLRMTLDGAPAPGNPGGSWDPYVFTSGHRNPQGLAFRPSDGTAFSVEHGTGCDDELNRLVAGANYGWNPVGAGGGYDENAPMTSPAVAGAAPAVWSSGCPTIAPSGATFLSGAPWGPWQDQLVMAVLKGTRLTFVRLNGGALAGVDTRFTTHGRLRTAVQAPDGALWVAQDANPGTLFRLVPG